MKRLDVYLLATTLLLTGLACKRWLNASPSQVFGSANLPVDCYVNQQGTFLLWSDGRVTDAGGDSTDLARPYEAPPAAAHVTDPVRVQGRNTGSPNQAVKALTTPQGTLILFADGTLKKPSRANAAAPGVQGGSCTIGGWGWNGPQADDYQVTIDGAGAHVHLETAPAPGSICWAVGFTGTPSGPAPTPTPRGPFQAPQPRPLPTPPPAGNRLHISTCFLYESGSVNGNTVNFPPDPHMRPEDYTRGFFVITDP